jgi:hypothetical protein
MKLGVILSTLLVIQAVIFPGTLGLATASEYPDNPILLSPTDDTKIKQEKKGTNFGNQDSMTVLNGIGFFYDDHKIDSLVRFDLSSLPPGAEIYSATLSLYYYKYDGYSPKGRSLACYRIMGDWQENTVKWKNRPPLAPEPTSESIVPSKGKWMDWDVKNDVQAFVDGVETNYGWQIRDDVIWGPKIMFRTKEKGKYIPCLKVILLKPLLVDVYTVSESTGGAVNFNLIAGTENALRNYILLGSVTGTSPGTPLPGGIVTLPLNWDSFTDFVFALMNTPVFMNFMGALDSFGNGAAQLNAPGPLPPGTKGITLSFAYALNNTWNFVSNPVSIDIVE